MASSTKTRYAKSGDVDIAYQVLGDGPIDLLLYTGASIPIDCMDEEPSLARFQRRLTSFARLLRFDPRGIGLSDRGSPASPPTPEEWAQDGLAVLDAVGSVRAAVIAPWVHAPAGLVLAAQHPDRVSSLVVINGRARVIWAPDYPMGLAEQDIDVALPMIPSPDAVELGFDLLSFIAPSVADDGAFRAWWDRSGNLGSIPAMARAILYTHYHSDVREYLPLVHAPTLVIQRCAVIPAESGPYLAERIGGARFVNLPGVDVIYWVGETGPVLDEIEEFLTGARGASGAERVFATVLFSDIVGSTQRAASVGDTRWRDLLDRHDQLVRAQIERFWGRIVKTVGDGAVATFDSPSRAIECALAIRHSVRLSDLEVRVGIHAGEIEVRAGDIGGLAVHIAARVVALTPPGEVLVSSAVPPLVAGSGIEFDDRGEHELKGVPGTWRLFAVMG